MDNLLHVSLVMSTIHVSLSLRDGATESVSEAGSSKFTKYMPPTSLSRGVQYLKNR